MQEHEELYKSRVLTPAHGFTNGIEGPAVDKDGCLYAVNFHHQSSIGKVWPDGRAEVFVDLPQGSIGNGIRFHSRDFMLVADYTGHNVLKIEMPSRKVSVYAHQASMNQPNDIAIASNDLVFASDPNWQREDGQIWLVEPGKMTLLESGMGTTNGIEVSPADRFLYVNESVQRRIWAYDLLPNGRVSRKRLLIEFPDFDLDGMRCDIAGNLYVTRYGKGTVAKLSPSGQVLLEVTLHGKNPSNVAFGGPDGRTCYVTVADQGNVEYFRTELPGLSYQLQQKGHL